MPTETTRGPSVFFVGMTLRNLPFGPVHGHLSLDGIGEQLPGSAPENLRQDVPVGCRSDRGNWNGVRLCATLTDGGVSMPAWAVWVLRTHP